MQANISGKNARANEKEAKLSYLYPYKKTGPSSITTLRIIPIQVPDLRQTLIQDHPTITSDVLFSSHGLYETQCIFR